MEKKFEAYDGSEDLLQESVAILLDYYKVLWFHPPNGGRRSMAAGKKMKRSGTKPGVSDCIILEPRGKYHGLFIELKNKKGSLQNTQKDFIARSLERGYKAIVCRSIDEVEYELKKYLNE